MQKSIYSVTWNRPKKSEILQRSMKMTGEAPKNRRGKHNNHPHKLSDVTRSAIRNHIKSFKDRKSHYRLHDSAKLYLPEELNIKKMFNMYCEKFPNLYASYETYRTIFSTEFNIAFGYPRSGTCSQCDEYTVCVKPTSAGCEKGQIDVKRHVRRNHHYASKVVGKHTFDTETRVAAKYSFTCDRRHPNPNPSSTQHG
ncbi:hypothetical protein NQ318_009836 [Aromia moschata]|uniref:Transposase n=1 Tax=Aromia moschata TaxID=1265417 RepID=A0AAV8XNE7_9CUCU|nr:hypothetical protein NQ318_009836 [Aromia moschata]